MKLGRMFIPPSGARSQRQIVPVTMNESDWEPKQIPFFEQRWRVRSEVETEETLLSQGGWSSSTLPFPS